ncbi:hypothetical protein KDH_75570 [Dictyobacter sp. S3.2.2.5]|uniref:Uncharacterized protein n=1 Tax=Dictyobacter halimunensis TaxID=3026934 RepID=A0ABQ6G4H8_9CHLR|nr:hypothetical protein KDH_75570 [Dictyobacter sp. S3.2.2.5]
MSATGAPAAAEKELLSAMDAPAVAEKELLSAMGVFKERRMRLLREGRILDMLIRIRILG